MVVVRDEATGCRLVSVQDLGWLFYRPASPTNPGCELFISFDDYHKDELEEWASLLSSVGTGIVSARDVFFSKDFARMLLRRLVAFYGTEGKERCRTCAYRHSRHNTCRANPARCVTLT